MEEHSDYALSLLLKDYYHKVDGPHQGHKLIQVHKVDGHHQGSRPQSTYWTDPTRVTNFEVDEPHQGSRLQSTKWTDPTRVTNLYKSTKWTDPTKG